MEEVGIAVGGAEFGIGEAWVSGVALAFAFVEIVANGADEFVAFARESFEGLSEEGVGLAGAVDVRSDEGADPLFVGEGDATVVMLFGQNFAEVHVASATPCSVGDGANLLSGGNFLAGQCERFHDTETTGRVGDFLRRYGERLRVG